MATSPGAARRRPVVAGSKMGFFRRMAVNSTEGKFVLALSAILALGIGVTTLLAYSSQTSSVSKVEAYMDSLRTDWDKYQTNIQSTESVSRK